MYDGKGNMMVSTRGADGSWWVYTYDLYGQLVSGRRYWADSRPVAGQQFEYRHDAIGNRTAGSWGGDELGQSLRWSTNTVNRLNQYTSRTVPGYVGVSGEAAEAATVTLWWGSNEWARAIQQGRYWYGEALVNNATGSVWVVITNLGVVRGQPDRVQSETGSAFVAQTPETLIHDLDGNLARDGRWMYYWDAENRLTRVITVAGPSSSFRRVEWKYDAWGRRTRQTTYVLSNGVWQVVKDLKFVSDPELFGRHVAELNATNNSLVRAYIWGLDLSGTLDAAGGVGGLLWVRAATGPAAGTHFVCYDGNGNVWNLVSATTGTETARYEYGPFGEPLRLSGPAARFNPFRFSTKRSEDFTSLVLYEHRAYNPTLGRWLSRDPIGEGGGAHLHAFVANEPPGDIDTDGRFMGIKCPFCGQWYHGWHECRPNTEPPSLVMGESCMRFSDIASAIALANRALRESECAKWFRDHGSHGERYRVRCHGNCKFVCLFGGTAWTYAGWSAIGLCPGNLTRYTDSGIAALLIHEVAHHYCPVIGGESCANHAMEACEPFLTR